MKRSTKHKRTLVTIELLPQERDLIKQIAARDELRVASWIRRLIRRELSRAQSTNAA